MRHWLHLCWTLPLLLVVMTLGALDYLAYTEGGVQFIASSLNQRSGPITVRVQGASGTLAYGLHIDKLTIDHRRSHIELTDVSGFLIVLPLAWRTIHVPSLHARHLMIHVLPHIDDHRFWEPHFLPPLMRIDADRLDVDSWKLVFPSGDEYDTHDVTASGTVLPKIIHIYDGSFTYLAAHVRTNGDVLAQQSTGVKGALHIDAQAENQPPWTVNARMDGNMLLMALDANFGEPFAAVFHGQIENLTSNWHWQGRALVRRFDLGAWNAGHALGLITGNLLLDGDRGGFRAHGSVDPPGLHSGPLQAQFSGSYHARVLSVEQVRLRHEASGTVLESAGTVSIVPGGPKLDLHGSWNHFRWPLASAEAPFHSEHGIYTLQEIRPFAYSTEGDLKVASLAPMQINMRGRLGVDGITADNAQVLAFGAQSQLSGQLHWVKASDWKLQGRVTDLDVARLRPQISGRVNFAIAASGDGFGPRSPLDATLSDLSGAVRGQRAQGHAQIVRRDGDWNFNDVRVQLGATRIELDGHAGSTVDLNFAVDAADLALLQSDAHGQFVAHGRIRGNLSDPTIITAAQGHNVEWRGMQMQSLDANLSFDPHGSGRADSIFRLQDVQIGARKLEQLTFRSDGTTANHTVSLEAKGEGFTLATRGTGHYAAGHWQGEIASAQFGNGAHLHMTQESAAALLFDADHVHLEPLCLHDAGTRVCINANLDPAQRNVELLVTNLPMRTLTAGLSGGTDYDGSLSVAMNANSSGAESWRGNLEAHLENAAIHKHFSNGRVETLDLGDGVMSALIREHDLSGNLALDAGNAGSIKGKFAARGTDDNWREWPLVGEVALETTALGYVSTYVAQLDRASGRVSAKLNLSGSANSPRLDGELKLQHAALDAYQINLSLRDVNFVATLTDDQLSLDGSALAGPDGHANVKGNLHWQHGLPYGDLHLVGEDLRVLSIPEARVDASPDVYVHLDGRRIDLHGQVVLPYARIAPANLANAVLTSSDEVIVTDEAPPPPEDQFKVSSNLTLTLGERVTVNTHGLSGRLSGKINVASDDTGINRGSGELTVEEGKYLAYGRNLDIEHGRLLFSNGLLGDPGLDLRAVKKFPDITAGINVRGTLRTPRMTFFSDPEVPQSQIVSLLLAGGSLESVQNSTDPSERNGNSGRSDALLQGGAILAQQLGGRYNIEAGVEQDLTNETSLVLGRYLSPRLYVSYGVGLAEAINTIKMRYTIGDHWTIKTEAGTQRSADLVFTIEK